MFKTSLTIRTADEARASRKSLRASLEASDISEASKSILVESVSRTLELWRVQLERATTKSLKADQIFEGAEYRVVLKARAKSDFFSAIKKMFGHD